MELSDLGDGGGDRRDPGTIHQEGSPGSQAGGVRYGPAPMGEKLEALMGEIKDDREQWKQWEARRESGDERQTWNVTRAISRENARPMLRKDARETDSRRRRNRCGTPGGCDDRGVGHGGKWTIPPWTDRGE